VKPGLFFKSIWSDEDVVELEIEVSDSISLFSFKAYLGQFDLREIISSLDRLENDGIGNTYDMKIGKFGPEHASGALSLSLQYLEPYKIFVTAKCQSGYSQFFGDKVASEASLYFITAPLLLKFFIDELKEFEDKKKDSVYLQAA